jgi:hypothetical protein
MGMLLSWWRLRTPHLKTGRPAALSSWLCRQPRRPTARAVSFNAPEATSTFLRKSALRPGIKKSSCYAVIYAATKTISKTPEKSAGTGKMKRQAIMPLANVATANIAIIGRACIAFERAREAIFHRSADCNSKATLIDQPNPIKKSRYDRFAPMVSNRTVAIALSTSFSPIGDHLFIPPSVCPAAKSSEMTAAILRNSVVVIILIPATVLFLEPRCLAEPHRAAKHPD